MWKQLCLELPPQNVALASRRTSPSYINSLRALYFLSITSLVSAQISLRSNQLQLLSITATDPHHTLWSTSCFLCLSNLPEDEDRRTSRCLYRRTGHIFPSADSRYYHLRPSRFWPFFRMDFCPDSMPRSNCWWLLPARDVSESVRRIIGSDDHPRVHWNISFAPCNTRSTLSMVSSRVAESLFWNVQS